MMSEAQTLKSEGVMYNIMAQKRVTNEWDLNDLLKKLDRLNEENAPSDNKEKSDDDEFNLDDFDMKDLDSSKDSNKDSDDKNNDDDESLEDLDMGDMSDDDSKKNDSDDQEDKDEFATDNAGLMNTINDLIAQGKTVKIVISQETGQPEFVVTDKTRSFQENKNSDPKVRKVKTVMNENKEKELNRILKGLISRYNKLSEDVQNIKTDASIDMSWIYVPSYDSYPTYNASNSSAPINESNYNTSLEEQTINLTADEFNDLVGVIEELDERSESLEHELYNIKMNQYNGSIIDEDLDNAIREADAAVNDLNESINADILQTSIRNTRVTSSRYAALNALGIYTNYITPNVLEISEAKGVLLSNVGGANDTNWSAPFHNGNIPSYSFNELDKALDRVDNLSVISQISTKFNESSMSPAAKLEAVKILDNAASAISFNSGNYGKYTYFSDYIVKDLKHKPSTDIGVAPDDSGYTMNIVKSSLPFMKPEEYNPKQTFNSAIINLEENLLDIDGKVKDFDMCDKVYLYKKVSSPTSLKDYAIPIASFNESDGQFYLNPILIEKSASMLKNESCMKLYDIPYKEKLNELREKLLPYLEKLNIVAPWLETV